MANKSYQIRLEDMNLNELVDYWTGRFALAVGRGDVRSEISLMLSCTLQLGAKWSQEKEKKTK